MSPKVVIFFIAIAVCVSVLNAHPDELRKRRQAGSGSSTTAAPSGDGSGGSGSTTPASGGGDSSTASSGSGGSGGSRGGLFTYLATTLQGIPIAGGILFTVLSGLGGVLGGILPFLG